MCPPPWCRMGQQPSGSEFRSSRRTDSEGLWPATVVRGRREATDRGRHAHGHSLSCTCLCCSLCHTRAWVRRRGLEQPLWRNLGGKAESNTREQLFTKFKEKWPDIASGR